ncbi:MAG: T9SS type A sorting domain-containing protein [Flavobacteriaceae bacterium]
MSISDVYGKEVLNLVREIRNESISIAIPNLEAGIFVIRITSEEQQVHTKFYKQ